ncbi:NAD(P)H-dependent oxidoreductase subunit E [Actinomycetota bacterium]
MARRVAQGRQGERGALLVILREVVAEQGRVTDEDIADIADVLNLSVADVTGVVGFYHDLRRTPPPTHTLSVCRGEACQSVGSDDLHRELVEQHAGRDDVEVSEVFCLGNCALGPSGMLDGRLHGRLSTERVQQLTQGWSR